MNYIRLFVVLVSIKVANFGNLYFCISKFWKILKIKKKIFLVTMMYRILECSTCLIVVCICFFMCYLSRSVTSCSPVQYIYMNSLKQQQWQRMEWGTAFVAKPNSFYYCIYLSSSNETVIVCTDCVWMRKINTNHFLYNAIQFLVYLQNIYR